MKNKKITSIVLTIILTLSLCACNVQQPNEILDNMYTENLQETETIIKEEITQTINPEEKDILEQNLKPTEPNKEIEIIEPSTESTETIKKEEIPTNTNTTMLNNVEVHFIDVGQADSILFEIEDKYMLVDAGNNEDGDLIVDYLKNQGVSTIDYLIGTHPHEDHIGGLDDVIYNFEIKNIIMPEVLHTSKTFEDVLDAIASKNYSITKPIVGEVYNINNSSFKILGPVSDYGDDFNNWSVGIKFTTGDIDFVMCGDAENKAEADMLKVNKNLEAEVLKLGHHGSSTSSSKAFVDAINPKYAVISVGEGNSYGHPHWETKDMLDERNIQYFRTDQQGTIIAHTDGKNLTWSTQPIVDGYTNYPKNNPTEIKPTEKIENHSVPIVSEIKSMDYILNTNTKKFHYPECSSAKRTKESNKEYFTGTREEIINRGYSPCGNCNP